MGGQAGPGGGGAFEVFIFDGSFGCPCDARQRVCAPRAAGAPRFVCPPPERVSEEKKTIFYGLRELENEEVGEGGGGGSLLGECPLLLCVTICGAFVCSREGDGRASVHARVR